MTKQPDQLGRWVEHPPLRSVQLENFKSVFSQDVDLGMLTVLVGKNSAGKSTLLDAILMRSQAGTDFREPGIPLNGHLLNLGTFDDVLNANCNEDPLVRVGAAISVNFDDEPRPGPRGPRRPLWRNRGDQDLTSRSARQTRFFSLAEEAYRTIARTINERGFLRRPKPYDLAISWSIGFRSDDEVACCDLSLDSESAGPLVSATVSLVDTDGRPRPALLQHLSSVGQSIEYQPDHPPTFGEATHHAEEQAKAICEAVLVDGLPEAVRTARDAKQLVVRALVDYWVELLEEALFLVEDPEAPLALTRQQNLRLPLEQEPTDQLSALESHGRPTGWGEDEELAQLVDDLAEQAALWVKFYLEGGDRLRDELRRMPRNRLRSSSSGYYPQDFFEGHEIYPMASLGDAKGKKAEITGRLDAGGGPEGGERLGEAIRRTGRAEESRLPSALVASLGRFYAQVGVGQFYDRVEAAVGSDDLGAAIIMDQDFNHALSSLRRAVQEFMVNHVSHIGPLRLGPQPLYTQGRDDRLPTVGQKGENTAAVLANQGATNVVCPKKDGPPEEMPLSDAIAYWLGKDGLELVDGIRSTPWGAAGYELKVKPIGIDKWVHLMAVGTGVSQVLPVLVQGLLINPGSVLVLQEPGSQLHPALQQDLGDFLLACAQSGKQVILETHSEYLVSRLARRIAEGAANADVVKLLRVDHSKDAGTTYQPAPIDDYGNIKWPEGFFQEASDEAFKILDAGLAKQAAQED